MEFTRKPQSFYFQDKYQARNVGKKSAQGYLISFGTNVFKLVINLGSISILARLLDPRDFGLVAMVMALISIPKMVMGLQLATGVVQSQSLNQSQITHFFWFNTGICLVGSIGVFFCSPVVAWFYNEPILTDITKAMTVLLLFAGMASTHRSLLSRTLQFGVLSFVDFFANTMSKVAAVVLAISGFGVWALVGMHASYEGCRMIVLWFVCRYRPGLPATSFMKNSLLLVGSVWSANAIFSSLISELDRILIGRFLNSTALGLYSRSYNLAEMPGRLFAWPMDSIAIASLSRLQNETQKFEKYFLFLTEIFLFLFIPVLMMMFLSAKDIVLLVLGDKWVQTVPIFRWLILYFTIRNMGRPIGWFLTAEKHSLPHIKKIAFRTLVANVAFVFGIALGLFGGVIGVAASLPIASMVSFWITIYVVFEKEQIRPGDYLKLLWKPFVAAATALLICFWIPFGESIGFRELIFMLIIKSLTAFLVYVLIYLILPGGLTVIKDGTKTIRDLATR